MKLEKNEIRVALFILIPLTILLLFIVLKLGYSIAGSTIDVYLKVDSISSIKNGTKVMIKGYEIGRVVEIRPVYRPALHFLAVLRIRHDIDLYEDCSAVIMNQNIIGDPIIEFRNPEKKGELLTDGSVVEGIEYVSLDVVLQDVHELLTSLSSTVQVFKEISMESKSNLRVLVANLSESVTTLNQMLLNSQRDIIQILTSFRDTARNLNEISVEFKRRGAGFLLRGKKE
jgi:phospholipid/cholesterol/gamma-HCH transport system substrate-binding protein